MRLVDLLVKELPKRGGWPEGAIYICTEKDGTPRIVGSGWHDNKSLSSFKVNDDKGIIDSMEYESALAASEGWIDWHGGDCPVDSDAIVEVKFRNPIRNKFNNNRAGDFNWSHDGFNGDIIAYRMKQPGINSRTNDERQEQDLNECIGQGVDMPEWMGDGLPPVGTICQAKVPRSITGWEWRKVKVVESGTPGAEKEVLVYDLETTLPAWTDELRPLRTEAEMAREKLAASLHIAAGASPIELNGIGPLYFKLADAIISGSIFGTTFKAGK